MPENISVLPSAHPVAQPPGAPGSAALRSYLDMDLSHDAPVAQDLFARVNEEAGRASLNLTGDGDDGAASANLTPGMSRWLGTHVMGKRQAALSDIKAAAGKIRLGGNIEGVVPEIEEDRLKRGLNGRVAELARSFHEKHQGLIAGRDSLRREHDALRAQEGGRDALVPSRWVEFGLPLLVAVPEGFMNYGSFVALTGLGVAGLGLTMVVGFGIGLAAWLAGRVWKAWHFYMRADDEDQQQRGLRMLWLASSLLTVSLGVVGYARFRTVAERAERELVLGLDPSNPVTATLLLLTGNLLVFFVGAAITYVIHDENPLFAEKAAKLREAEAAFEAVKARDLIRPRAEAEKGYKQKLGAMHKRAALMGAQTDYAAVAEDLGRVNAKDQEIVGLLQDYRGRLVGALERRDPDFRFNVDAGNAGGDPMSLGKFGALPLRLLRD